MRVLALVTAVLLPAALWAAEIRSLELTRDEDKYLVASDVFMTAPPGAVFDVLIDYENFHRLSSAFKETRFIEPIVDGRGLVFLHMEVCVLFFCKDVKLVEEIRVESDMRVAVTILPEQSDLNYGWSSWEVSPSDDGGSLVRYELEMQPGFWVPPVIGPMIMKKVARSRGLRAARRVEAIAAGEPMPPDLVVETPEPG